MQSALNKLVTFGQKLINPQQTVGQPPQLISNPETFQQQTRSSTTSNTGQGQEDEGAITEWNSDVAMLNNEEGRMQVITKWENIAYKNKAKILCQHMNRLMMQRSTKEEPKGLDELIAIAEYWKKKGEAWAQQLGYQDMSGGQDGSQTVSGSPPIPKGDGSNTVPLPVPDKKPMQKMEGMENMKGMNTMQMGSGSSKMQRTMGMEGMASMNPMQMGGNPQGSSGGNQQGMQQMGMPQSQSGGNNGHYGPPMKDGKSMNDIDQSIANSYVKQEKIKGGNVMEAPPSNAYDENEFGDYIMSQQQNENGYFGIDKIFNFENGNEHHYMGMREREYGLILSVSLFVVLLAIVLCLCCIVMIIGWICHKRSKKYRSIYRRVNYQTDVSRL